MQLFSNTTKSLTDFKPKEQETKNSLTAMGKIKFVAWVKKNANQIIQVDIRT